MDKDDKRQLTPRLRFPEFREGEAWTTEPMERLYSFVRNNALSRDKLNYRRGSVKNIHYGDIHTKFQTLFDITQESVPFINDTEPLPPFDSKDYCVEGDLIFADASEDTNDVGKSIEIVRLNGERLLSGQHTILARRNGERLILGFGGHLFRSGRIRFQVMKEAQGTKVYAISATRLGSVEVAFPADKKEQQKIADCLTSLDALIAAQGRKVEALKVHKKGLLHQLFPREGETLPRLRFPEFRGAGEWECRKIRDLLEKVSEPIEVETDRTYREIGIRSHGKGIFHKAPVTGAALGSKRVFRVVQDAFILNIIFAWERAVAFTTKNEAGMIASHRFPMYLPKLSGCDVRFLRSSFSLKWGNTSWD